jgi:hypothetical protein
VHDDSTLDELVATWTLVAADWELVGNKTGSARAAFEKSFCDQTLSRMDLERIDAIERLVADATETGLLAELKSDPGQLGLETLLREITKLNMVRSLNIPVSCSIALHRERLKRGGHAQLVRTDPIFLHHRN